MRLSLPLRIFLVHFAFMAALGAVGLYAVNQAFEDYAQTWEDQLDTQLAQNLMSPLANEVARSLLLKLEQGPPEFQEQHRAALGQALDNVLPTLPSIERLIIVDPALGVQYAYQPDSAKIVFDADKYPALELGTTVRREAVLRSGEKATEVVFPVFPGAGVSATEAAARLGSVIIRYRSDPGADSTEQVDGREAVFQGMAGELARSLLLEPDRSADQAPDDYAISISDGLSTVLSALPIESMVVVDRDLRIRYINDPEFLDLTFAGSEKADLLNSDEPERNNVDLFNGEQGIEWMLPVWDDVGGDGPEARRRLGSLLIRYRPDPGLSGRLPELKPPSVRPGDFVRPLIILLAVAVLGGILLGAFTGLPVRRLERAVADFRARGFKGGLDPKLAGVPGDLVATVQAVNEMGGRLEALDDQGRDRELLLATLSQSLEDGMIAVDPDGTPAAWNPAALRILGLEADVDDENGTVVGDDDKLKQALERNPHLLLGPRPGDPSQTSEVEILRADASRAPARVTRVASELRPGESGTLLVISDLAALRKVEAHLLEAGRFAVLAHLAAGLAHEIRNPLHAIQLNAAVVEQYAHLFQDEDSDAVAESLATVKDETQRLTDLLNNYLAMVRPGKETGPVDVRELCRKVIQLVGHTARKSHIEISLEGESNLPVIEGAANHVQQAILNLVINAIQAMPDGGTLTLRTEARPGIVRITVSDTGPGLAQELADQLFDTRVTTKPEGSGLGLPMVRMVAESHGGAVWYRSTSGEGASFSLVFPTPSEHVDPGPTHRF